MRKIGAAFLTMKQKHHREDVSIECLAIFHSNKVDFLLRFITMNATWAHHSTSVTKEQSKQWTEGRKSAPKKAKTVLSADKVMTSVF